MRKHKIDLAADVKMASALAEVTATVRVLHRVMGKNKFPHIKCYLADLYRVCIRKGVQPRHIELEIQKVFRQYRYDVNNNITVLYRYMEVVGRKDYMLLIDSAGRLTQALAGTVHHESLFDAVELFYWHIVDSILWYTMTRDITSYYRGVEEHAHQYVFFSIT